MRSNSVKHSVLVNGKMTAVATSNEDWFTLKLIAKARDTTLGSIIGEVDASRGDVSLSKAVRAFVTATRAALPGVKPISSSMGAIAS